MKEMQSEIIGGWLKLLKHKVAIKEYFHSVKLRMVQRDSTIDKIIREQPVSKVVVPLENGRVVKMVKMFDNSEIPTKGAGSEFDFKILFILNGRNVFEHYERVCWKNCNGEQICDINW